MPSSFKSGSEKSVSKKRISQCEEGGKFTRPFYSHFPRLVLGDKDAIFPLYTDIKEEERVESKAKHF